MRMIHSQDINALNREMFDKWAHDYDGGLWSMYFKRAYKKSLDILKIPKSSIVLDLGCGTGTLSLMIAKTENVQKIVGIDISSEMIKIAEKKQIKNNISGNKLLFGLGSADKIDYPDSYFDVIYCLNSFHHYSDHVKTLKEIYRLLKNGGYFILLDPFLDNPIRKLWGFFLKKIFNEAAVRYYKSSELQNIFRCANFHAVKQKSFLYFTLFTVANK